MIAHPVIVALTEEDAARIQRGLRDLRRHLGLAGMERLSPDALFALNLDDALPAADEPQDTP